MLMMFLAPAAAVAAAAASDVMAPINRYPPSLRVRYSLCRSGFRGALSDTITNVSNCAENPTGLF